MKYSRKLKCWYIAADVKHDGLDVSLFLIRRSKRGPWGGLITTNTRIDFFEAYRIYSRRRSQEVIHKEAKQLLGMGKCQGRNFTELIAHTTIVALQYNILSTVKRFHAYETIGGFFREISKNSLELTITQRIWEAIVEIVIAFVNIFQLTEEDVMQVVIGQSDVLAHICENFKLKVA